VSTAAAQLAEERQVWEYVFRTVWRNATKRGPATLDESETASIVAESVARKWHLWSPERGQTKRAAFLAEAAWRDYLKVIRWWSFREDEQQALELDRKAADRMGEGTLYWRDLLPATDDPAAETLDTLERQEQARRVREALAQLSVADQELIHARMWQGHTFAKIAAREGVTEQAIYARYKWVLRRLRRLLEGDL
jgi:RNA polymerase sigma factor (sigma-70 family)